MSLVVFPFKHEDERVVASNLHAAAAHERVDCVWAVSAAEGQDLDRVRQIAEEVASTTGTTTQAFSQQRLGVFRGGKGDGMNTAISRAADSGFDRMHFYDADITNFDSRWIDGAEHAADNGYDIVRHRFPRASTDAMITWMVTRPSLALLFPGTVLPRIGQPLGGELLLTRAAIEALARDSSVIARSDWGVDTMITHATATLGLPMYEHNVREGKRHALYGTLDEIRDMVLECLDAVRSLRAREGPDPGATFAADPPAPAPEDLKRTVGYDVNATIELLSANWSDEEVRLAHELPNGTGELIAENRKRPLFDFMSEERWGEILRFMLDEFDLVDPVWRDLAFRLWLARVLSYTTQQALAGYDAAISYLESTIHTYEKWGHEDARS